MTPPRALRGSPALASAVASLAPIVFLLWLWGDGLQTWFVADDFAWLGLLRQVGTFSDFLRAMFAPAAQGTFRFLSERGFFLRRHDRGSRNIRLRRRGKGKLLSLRRDLGSGRGCFAGRGNSTNRRSSRRNRRKCFCRRTVYRF